jgi:hypothetical protein
MKQHFKSNHSKDCEVKSPKGLSHDQILRIKFNGQQEGRKHIELKNNIVHSLEINKHFKNQVKEVHNDKRHKLSIDENSKEWKKPDVFTIIEINNQSLKIAIEIQLATTFIDVIKERQHFYKRDKSYILWVFEDFNTNLEELKMTYIDVFVDNSKNAFVINQETIQESEKRNDLVLLCYYRKFYKDGNKLGYQWESEFITLDELTYSDDYKAYYYNEDLEKEIINNQIKSEAKKEKQIINPLDEKAREKFILQENLIDRIIEFYNPPTELIELFLNIDNTFWTRLEDLFISGYQVTSTDKEFIRQEFKDYINLKETFERDSYIYFLALTTFYIKVNNPNQNNSIKRIERVLFAILSLKTKKIIGYNFPNIISVADRIIESRSDYMELYIKAVEKYSTYTEFIKNDKHGNFRKKYEKFKSSSIKQSKEFDHIFIQIFPELFN